MMCGWLIGLLLCLPALSLAADTLAIADFDGEGLKGWKSRVFQGQTEYTLVKDDGQRVLKAESQASASGLYKNISVDLTRTPWLSWRWKIKDTLGNINERSKEGDDYPARVYVVFSGGVTFWRTRSVAYVWSSNQPAGREWPNAFTDNARIIALQGGAQRAGEWIQEKRDVRADYKRLFGEDIEQADAIAIMTDTDNAGGSATAWYGDIHFSSQ